MLITENIQPTTNKQSNEQTNEQSTYMSIYKYSHIKTPGKQLLWRPGLFVVRVCGTG